METEARTTHRRRHRPRHGAAPVPQAKTAVVATGVRVKCTAAPLVPRHPVLPRRWERLSQLESAPVSLQWKEDSEFPWQANNALFSRSSSVEPIIFLQRNGKRREKKAKDDSSCVLQLPSDEEGGGISTAVGKRMSPSLWVFFFFFTCCYWCIPKTVMIVASKKRKRFFFFVSPSVGAFRFTRLFASFFFFFSLSLLLLGLVNRRRFKLSFRSWWMT